MAYIRPTRNGGIGAGSNEAGVYGQVTLVEELCAVSYEAAGYCYSRLPR